MKNIVILGSTGSIGRQAVEVVCRRPEKFRVIGLAAGANISLLNEQINRLRPKYVVVADKDKAAQVRRLIDGVEVLAGAAGLAAAAAVPEADLVLNAVVGAAGLPATLAAVDAGKDVALANKESLVAAGGLVKKALTNSTSQLIPVDSEHSAVYQCLLGESRSEISKIILTASGGPFRGRKWDTLSNVTPAAAAAHPRWDMGAKISVDSATLINKGLEVIEAHYLFDVPYKKIDIVIHPQSIVHSLVEFRDGSLKAHLGPTDMRLPIQYALSRPERWSAPGERLSLAETGSLHFAPVDYDNHPCLCLALEAAEKGGGFPAAMNAADEAAVAAFLAGRIKFTDIGKIIYGVLERHEPINIDAPADFKVVDEWARRQSESLIQKIKV